MKNLIVNENACIGCGSCIAIDPEHFDFNEDGLAVATNNENLDSSSLINAVGSCPTNAISVDNEETSCGCANCPGCSNNNQDNSHNCGCQN